MNKILKAFIIAVVFFLLSGFISVLIIAISGEEPKTHKSLLTDYSKLDIQTQVTQDVGIIEEQ